MGSTLARGLIENSPDREIYGPDKFLSAGSEINLIACVRRGREGSGFWITRNGMGMDYGMEWSE